MMASLSIGQLEKLLALPASTMRFWEKEVPYLLPERSRSGRRIYSLSEAAIIARFKHLALDRKLGLKRATQILEWELLYGDQERHAVFRQIRNELFQCFVDSERWKESHASYLSELRKGL